MASQTLSCDQLPFYRVNRFIDAKDSVNKWCAAKVVQVDEVTGLTIRFDGWSRKWDEKVSFRSSRIAPFRRRSVGYTGQTHSAIREWEFSLEELARVQSKLEELKRNGIVLESPYETTQFLRGDLFTFVDCLLTNSYVTPQDPLLVLVFFTKVIDLVLAWLQIPNLFKYYAAGVANPDLFMTDANVALSLAAPELFFTLERLMCGEERTARFFKNVDAVPRDYEPSPDTVWNGHYSKSVVYLANYFAKQNGYQILLDLVKRDNQRLAAFVAEWKPVVLSRLQSLNDRDLKDFDKDICTKLLSNLQVLVGLSDRTAPVDFVEATEMQLAMILLKCQYLEKRIRGLNEFRDLIARTAPQQRVYPGQQAPKRISKRALLAFMQEQNLVPLIISDRPHPEILKRSGEIFCFFAENESLSTEHLELLWSSRNDKHESYVRAVYEVLVTVSSYLNSDLKDALFQRFSEFPIDQYDEKYLRLLKDFSLNAVDQSPAARARSDVTNDYALPKFFSLMLDDPKTSTSLADLSSDLLLELLKSPTFRIRQEEYLDLALDNVIRRGESIPQSLKIILGILKPPTIMISRTLLEQMKKLEKKYSLLAATIQSIIKYISIARMNPPPSPESIVLGRYSHAINLSSRLSFLEFVLETLDKVKLSPEQIGQLWDCFVSTHSCSYDSDTFFKWLFNNLDGRMILGREAVEIIFERLLCGPQFGVRTVSEEAFACFTKYFLNVNVSKKRLEARGNAVVLRHSPDILGFAPLVDIAIFTELESVSEKAIKILVDLHMRLAKGVLGEKDKLWTGLLTGFVGKVRSLEGQDQPICRVLKLFNSFLDEAEGKPSKRSQKSQPVAQITIYFRLLTDTDFRRVQVNGSGCIGDVRRKIAEVFKQHPYNISLTIMNKPYTRFDDDIELSTFKNSITAVVDIARGSGDAIDPKLLMANSQELLDMLFELISRPAMESADLAWNLLMRLPTNEKIKGAIAGLGENWYSHLQTDSLHKLLYCLIIIDELSDSQRFCDSFGQKNGSTHILRVFFDNRVDVRHGSSLTLRYSLVMFRLLGKFLPPEEYEPERVILRTLSLLWETSQSLLSSSEEQPEAVETVKRASDLLTNVIAMLRDKHIATISIVNYPHMQGLLSSSLLSSSSPQFSDGMKNLFLTLSKKLRLETEILEHLLSMLDQAVKRDEGGSAYFVLTSKLVKAADERIGPRLSETKTQLIQELSTHKCEKSATDKDDVLAGILTVLRAIIKKQSDTTTADLVQLVLHTCLFEVPSVGRLTSTSPPKCKNPVTRKEALKLLNVISAGSPLALELIVTYLDKLHQDPHWRTSRRQDWNNHHATMERSQAGFVGIKNLGCTCYMSSILQQLFMLPTFREGILSVNVTATQPVEEDLLYQFQNTLTALQESDKQYINPKALTKAFKPNEGQAFNPLEQMDVDEFFNNFMDKIEEQIKPDPATKTLIQDHFGGLQTTELIGKGSCSHRSERAEPFLTLPLEVKNKRSIYESLDSFVKGETLEGDNAYQCDHCDAKVTAERRVCIRHLPNIMIFALRRFDFDLDTMNRLKLNDYCEFPMDIDLEPYTVEGMSRKDAQRELSKKQDLDGAVPERKYPDDYYQYRLRGVVVHMGTAESGHYYSFITDAQSQHWYEFNDTLVRDFDPKDIPAEAFGGEEKWNVTTGYGAQVVSLREKYRNGYLLFYERSGSYRHRTSDEDTLTPLEFPKKFQYSQTVLSIYHQVQDDNQKFWRRRNAFSHEYFEFLLKLADAHGHDTRLWKFFLSFFLTIFIRSKDRYKAEEVVKMLKTGLAQHQDVSWWLLEMITVDQVLKELLLDCPEAPMRKLIVSLAKIALDTITPAQQETFAIRLLHCLPQAKKPISRHFAQYFELLDFVAERLPVIYDRLQLAQRLLAQMFDDKKVLPDLPEVPEFQNADIYLGYTEGRSADVLYDKFSYAFYESGASTSYALRTIARFPEKIQTEDIKRYLSNKQAMAMLVRDANTKIASRALGRLFAFLCTDSLPLSSDYLKVVSSVISEVDYDKQKPLFRQLAQILKIRDACTPQRIEVALTYFLMQMKDNIAYIKSTESCIEFLYKMYCKVQEVQDCISARRVDLKFLEDWIKRSQTMGYPAPASYMSTYKQRTVQTVVTSSGSYTAKPSADKVEIAKRLVRGETPVVLTNWDSDEEYTSKELRTGDRVDVMNTAYMRWEHGTVVQNFGEVMQVRLEVDKSVIWVESDGDYLAPDGTKAWPKTAI